MAAKTKAKPQVQQPVEQATELEKMEEPLDEKELEGLYAWVDSIPLSRPKKNISRDFSDGVLVAELVKHFFPSEGIVETHNYTTANATTKKKENWYYLNRRVFSRMNFELAEDVINDLVACKPGMIEKVLLMLKVKIKRAEYARGKQSDKPEADQHHSMSQGRKDIKLTKAGSDDSKGNRLVKSKQVEHNPHQQRMKMPLFETDVIPRIMLEEREQEVLAKDEMMKILQAKISRLEHLLHLKDMRIDDLQNRVEAKRPTGVRR